VGAHIASLEARPDRLRLTRPVPTT